MYTILFSILFLIVGVISGWFFFEKYTAIMEYTRHDFEELFEKNPHPEIYEEDGSINRNEYIAIQFPPNYDPELDEFYIDIEDEEN